MNTAQCKRSISRRYQEVAAEVRPFSHNGRSAEGRQSLPVSKSRSCRHFRQVEVQVADPED